MAQITFSIPDARLSEVLDLFCSDRGYMEFIFNPATQSYDLPNPETKAQFARRLVKGYFIEPFVRVQTEVAAAAASNSAKSQVD